MDSSGRFLDFFKMLFTLTWLSESNKTFHFDIRPVSRIKFCIFRIYLNILSIHLRMSISNLRMNQSDLTMDVSNQDSQLIITLR